MRIVRKRAGILNWAVLNVWVAERSTGLKITIEPDLPNEDDIKPMTFDCVSAFALLGYTCKDIPVDGLPHTFNHTHGPAYLIYERVCGYKRFLEHNLGSTNH